MSNWLVWKQEKEYQKLFWSAMISGIGSRFTQVASLGVLYELTESAFAIGLLFVIRMAPFLIFAPLGGMLADSFSKIKMMMIMDVVRVPIALLPIIAQHPTYIWIIYVSAFLLSTGEAMHAPTRMSIIPEMVIDKNVLHVNAIEQILVGTVLIIGSSVGGIVSYLLGTEIAFLLDGVSYLLSALYLSTIVWTQQRKSETKHKGKERSIRKMLLSSSVLIVLVFIECTMPIANGIDNVLISIYALDIFQKGELGVGWMYACLGLGFVLSSFFSNKLKYHLIVVLVICIGLEGVGHLLLSKSTTFSFALLFVLFITLVGGMSNICLNTLAMQVIPKQKHGTFFGFIAMISNTSLGISMGAAGFLLEVIHPRQLSFFVGVTYMIFAILYTIMFFSLHLKKAKSG